jgi:hypothetical protein
MEIVVSSEQIEDAFVVNEEETTMLYCSIRRSTCFQVSLIGFGLTGSTSLQSRR